MKKYLLILILILCLTFPIISYSAWLASWDYRIELSIGDYAGDIGGEVTWFPVTVFLNSEQGEEVFTELVTDAEYLKVAFTKADGTTELYAEKELFTHLFLTSQYPPAQSDTYVKTTTKLNTDYWAYFATDPTKSVTGGYSGKAWLSESLTITNQRFHIDLGSTKIVRKIYYENCHNSGANTNVGIQNFTFWGSNTGAGTFDDLVWGNDGGWTELTVSQNTFDQHIASDVADPKYITVTNSTAYQYYAFKFADNYGNVNWMGVRRIELQTEDPLAIYHISRDGWTINANTSIFLYYDSTHADNTDWIGEIGSTPAEKVWNDEFLAVYHKMDLRAPLGESFEKDEGNPFNLPGYDTEYGVTHPCVLYFETPEDGYKYWMYYEQNSTGAEADTNVYLVRSNDGVTWVETGITNPVLDIVDGLHDPNVVKVGNTWYLYGIGAGDILSFTSANGKSWSNQQISIPKGDAEDWDDFMILSPSVIYENNTFYLWYVGAQDDSKGKLGLATSNNGQDFTKDENNPLLEPTADAWDSSRIWHIGVTKYNGTYWLYYSGHTQLDNTGMQFGLAKSTNKIDWTKCDNNPILSYGIGWESSHLYKPSWLHTPTGEGILDEDNKIWLYYSAVGTVSSTLHNIGLARSWAGIWNNEKIIDSTSNSYNGTKKGAGQPAEADGKIGLAQLYDGSDDWIKNATLLDTTPVGLTLEVVSKITAKTGATQAVIIKRNVSGQDRMFLLCYDNNTQSFDYEEHDTGYVSLPFNDNWVLDTFQYLAVTWDTVNGILLYKDGAGSGSDATATTLMANGTYTDFYLGYEIVGSRFPFKGIMDEVRVSSTQRVATWIKGTKNSLWDTLFTYGSEEEAPITVNAIFFGMPF